VRGGLACRAMTALDGLVQVRLDVREAGYGPQAFAVAVQVLLFLLVTLLGDATSRCGTHRGQRVAQPGRHGLAPARN
jgi:hypothetical protein